MECTSCPGKDQKLLVIYNNQLLKIAGALDSGGLLRPKPRVVLFSLYCCNFLQVNDSSVTRFIIVIKEKMCLISSLNFTVLLRG